MIRITKMSGKFYGLEMSDNYKFEMNEIRILVNEGTPVLIVNELSDLEDLYIPDLNIEDIIMVNREG